MGRPYTLENIHKLSEKYKVGDKVNVYQYIIHNNGKLEVIRKKGVVLERYSYHMVVEMENKGNITESFTYQDVVILKRVRHILGRPKVSRGE